uniref:adenosylhomocysteine nucleosidase n=1 Tax=Trepomonas sp. PC1 TaxID=1076344 RepID=A0A146KGG6_9EUKA|eukprot:JAP94974.1 5'-methylthioadenosine nucleosidase, S-adenosylhomocysteine nucleosidase [Trepomonas sp. PC1]
MIGVICATDREFEIIQQKVQQFEKHEHMNRLFYTGTLNGKKIVINKCGVGKVSCALTVAAMSVFYKIEFLIFVGTAGAIGKDVKIGDIIISKSCVQFDFDGRPFVEKCVVFSVGQKEIKADEQLVEKAQIAVGKFLQKNDIPTEVYKELGISGQKAHTGIIASGDQFVSSQEQKKAILADVPEALCNEMEGAAVAQACFELKIPYVVVRVVSDSADGGAHADYEKFCNKLAGNVTFAILDEFIQQM